MSETRPACGSFLPGHLVHTIQAQMAGERPCRRGVVALDGEWVVLTIDGSESRWWNHDAEHVRELIEAAGGNGALRPFGVLEFEADGEIALVSVASRPSRCRSADGNPAMHSLISTLTTLRPTVERCPECGSPEVLRILWGYPAPDEHGELPTGVEFGGCCVDETARTKRCLACGLDFGPFVFESELD